MEAALVSPFTTSQIKELERQALIYKYMVASVPIPPHLLQPSNTQLSLLSNMRFSKSGDLEPGRCKRTDGKKWRCAKDVAPNQKYCERHMNRGRPRSRKLVENQSPFNNNSNSNNKKICVLHHTNQDHESEVQTVEKSKIPIKHISAAAAAAYNEPNWGLDREMDSNEQQCQQLIPAIFQRCYDEEPLNLISYKNLEGVYQNNESNFSLSPDLVSLNTLIPRGFIDAWSNENPNPRINEMSVPLHGNLSYSSLNLSMAMGSSVEDCVGDHKAQVSSWLSHDSCAGFMDGGPLGEVLRSSTGSMGSNPVSPYDISPTDSSVCNSPTPEIVGFQWFS